MIETDNERARKHESDMMDKLLPFVAPTTAHSSISSHITPYQYPPSCRYSTPPTPNIDASHSKIDFLKVAHPV